MMPRTPMRLRQGMVNLWDVAQIEIRVKPLLTVQDVIYKHNDRQKLYSINN
jgi:hypothetical protein